MKKSQIFNQLACSVALMALLSGCNSDDSTENPVPANAPVVAPPVTTPPTVTTNPPTTPPVVVPPGKPPVIPPTPPVVPPTKPPVKTPSSKKQAVLELDGYLSSTERLSFGVELGDSRDIELNFINQGETSATQIKGIVFGTPELNFKGASYPGVGGNCGSELEQNKTCKIVLEFKPTDSVAVNSNLKLKYFDGQTSKVFQYKLRGVGVNPAKSAISPAPADLSSALGFANLGNTCFANATLKAIASLPDSINFTLSTPLTIDKLRPRDLIAKQGIQQSLHSLFLDLEENYVSVLSGAGTVPISSHHSAGLNHLYDSIETYLLNRNADKDYMKHLRSIHNIAIGLNPVTEILSSHPIEDHPKRDAEEFKKFLATKDATYISSKKYVDDAPSFLRQSQMDPHELLTNLLDLLNYQQKYGGIKLVSEVRFADGNKSRKDDGTLSVLELPIPELIPGSTKTTISQALENFVREETLSGDNQVYNEVSKKNEDAQKQLYLTLSTKDLPSHVIVELKRFKEVIDLAHGSIHLARVDTLVEISQTLEFKFLKKFGLPVDNKLSFEKNEMRLMTVVVHAPSNPKSIHGGHYYAYIYNRDLKQWYLHNDSQVIAVDFASAKVQLDIEKNGYIAIYGDKGLF